MTGLDRIIENALAEDIHTGDITTLAVVPHNREPRARLTPNEPLVVAGLEAADRVFPLLDPRIVVTALFADGDLLESGAVIAEILGDAASLLQGERVALNLLQRMCGVAT